MVLGIQIAGFLFGLFFLYYSFINYKRKEFTAKEFTFWAVAWAVFILITLFPFVLDPILKPLGFFRALDLFVITGFLFLTAMIFYTYTIVRKTQKQVETVVRNFALKKAKKK